MLSSMPTKARKSTAPDATLSALSSRVFQHLQRLQQILAAVPRADADGGAIDAWGAAADDAAEESGSLLNQLDTLLEDPEAADMRADIEALTDSIGDAARSIDLAAQSVGLMFD